MQKKKFSIIIPMYNSGKRIARCIKSIQTQTYLNYEVIIVNDGSTDDSLDVCNEMIKNDKRFYVYSQENQGVSAARNMALNYANGEYVMFIDSDDTIEEDSLEILNRVSEDYDIVAFGYNSIYEDSDRLVSQKEKKTILNREEAIKKMMYNEIFFGALWNKIFKREKILNVKFDTSLQIGEDLMFQYDILKQIDKVKVISQCLYNYYIYKENTTSSSNEHKWLQFEEITKKMLIENEKNEYYKYAIIKYVESNYFLYKKFGNNYQIVEYTKKNIKGIFWRYIFSPAYLKNKLKVIFMLKPKKEI